MTSGGCAGEPGGYGPWFCAFVVNTAPRPKKHTHIVAHAMPHLVVDALNRTAAAALAPASSSSSSKKRARAVLVAEDAQDCWILIFKIGPFQYWTDSVAFLNQWLCKTRGKIHRIERGLQLFGAHREQLGLCLWTQTRSRDEALAHYRATPQWVSRSGGGDDDDAAAAAADQDGDENVPAPDPRDESCRRYVDALTRTRALFQPDEVVTLDALKTILLY